MPKKISTGKKARPLSMTGALVKEQREFFAAGDTRDVSFRKNALKRLRKAVRDHYSDIIGALAKDLRKSEFEAYITEIAFFFQEADYAIRHVKRWSRPERVRTHWLLRPSSSRIIPEPYGTALIMGPWNYPFQLIMAPLVAAIAAGNTAVLKPSELAPETAKTLAAIVESVFPRFYIAVVQGGVEVSKELLEQPFDYIFFTGGTAVGRSVMEAASRNLTPVTLELGGKSPAIVHRDANIADAAKKIAWGKFLNAGQTCIAPDYVLVHREVKERLVQLIKENIRRFYGDRPNESPNYAKIINGRHLSRIQGLMKGGNVVHGGVTDERAGSLEPTLMDNVTMEDAVMKEEIFGPVLPLVEFGSIDEAIAIIRKNPTPLALYLFTRSREAEKRVLRDVQAGGIAINDTIIHIANYHLPFGGIGNSGMGAYHGKFGFDAFSHRKAVIKRRFKFDILFRYPPYKIPVAFLRKILG